MIYQFNFKKYDRNLAYLDQLTRKSSNELSFKLVFLVSYMRHNVSNEVNLLS